MKRPLRVGIIGANWGVHTHLPAWRSLDGVEVVAICTSHTDTAQAAASKYQIKHAFSDYRDMVSSDLVDIIDVGARPETRADMVNTALSNGKHVVAGMPFAVSYKEAKLMTNNLLNSKLVGAVDVPSSSNPTIRYIADLISNGYLGELHGFRINVEFPLVTKRNNNAGPYAKWYSRSGTGASSLKTQGAHISHPLVSALGPVKSVVSDNSIRLKKWPNPDGTTTDAENHDTTFSILELENGVTGSLNCSWSIIGGKGTHIEIWGSDRRIVLKSSFLPQSTDVQVYVSEDSSNSTYELNIPEEYFQISGAPQLNSDPPSPISSIQHLLASVRDEILGDGYASPGFEQAAHVQAIVEAIECSSEQKRWINLDEL